MHEVFTFGLETGTSTLRAHLFTQHLGLWVDSCDKFKIPITAESAKEPVAKYRASPNNTAHSPSEGRPADIPEYSHEAFVDAITQFIIADDQVYHIFLLDYFDLFLIP